MAGKNRKSSKPDSVIPPWQQAAPEGAGSALEPPPEEDVADAARSRAGSAKRRVPRINRKKGAPEPRRGGILGDAVVRSEADPGPREDEEPGPGSGGRVAALGDRGAARRAKPAKRVKVKRSGGLLAQITDALLSIRTRSTVMMIDGTRLTEVVLKADKVAAVSEKDHTTTKDALQAAMEKRGRRTLVWCGRSTARVSRPVEASEHPDVKHLADAQYLARVFGKKSLVAMSGTVAMTPNLSGESVAALDAVTPRMAMSGMCVNCDEDGIWLRVGRSVTEATLVHQGKISGWTILCDGLDSVAERIRQGQAPMRARSDLAERVLNETRRAIMQWQRTRTVPPWIWLHGPGGDMSGNVHKLLLAQSGCRVASPQVKEPTGPELSQYTPLLPVAMCSMSAPRLQRPATILEAADKATRHRRLRFVAAGLAVLVVMTAFAEYRSSLIRARIKEATTVINTAAKITANSEWQIIDTAEKRQPLMELLRSDDGPNWSMLFRLQENFPNDEGLLWVQASNLETTINTERCCEGISAYHPLLKELNKWARDIYGPTARASSSSSIQEENDGTIRVTSSLSLHEEEEE